MSWFRKHAAPAKQITITPPRPDINRKGIAIVACVRNEAAYIAEWARFHLAVGIAHFYIYDNGSVDGTRQVLAGCVPTDQLTIIPWAGRMVDASSQQGLNSQVIAFAHAILNFGGAHQRMAFIDVDEFLLPKTGRTVEDALAGAGGFPNVSLPWHMFGRSGHETKPAGPVALNYTMRGVDPLSTREHASNFKCIVDPCEVIEVSVHQFKTREHGDLTANDAGARFSRRGRKGQDFYSNRFLQLNHYYSKSNEELMAKVERGPASPASRRKYQDKVLTAVSNIEADVVEDRAMIDFVRAHDIDLGQ